MKDLRFIKLKGGNFSRGIWWKNTKGQERRISFEKIAFFYITPKLGFSCENKKLQFIIFSWLFWEIAFYRDVYEQSSITDTCYEKSKDLKV